MFSLSRKIELIARFNSDSESILGRRDGTRALRNLQFTKKKKEINKKKIYQRAKIKFEKRFTYCIFTFTKDGVNCSVRFRSGDIFCDVTMGQIMSHFRTTTAIDSFGREN